MAAPGQQDSAQVDRFDELMDGLCCFVSDGAFDSCPEPVQDAVREIKALWGPRRGLA